MTNNSSEHSQFINRCRNEMSYDNFILPKKYRATLLRVLKSPSADFVTPVLMLEILELIGLLEKRA